MMLVKFEDFNEIIDLNKDKVCLLAGTAPNIINFPFKKFKGVIVTIGDGPIRLKNYFKPNFWINSNSIFPIPDKDYEIINSFNETVFIFSDSVAYSSLPFDESKVKSKLNVKWYSFDQRHFKNEKCKPPKECCRILDSKPGRITLQEVLKEKYKTEGHYSTGSTVAIHGLAYAILMGCNPIIIHGIELPSVTKNYNYSKSIIADLLLVKIQHGITGKIKFLIKFMLNKFGIINEKTDFGKSRESIIDDFKYLADVANSKNQKIYILSKTSLLYGIKGIDYIETDELESILLSL